MAQLGSVGKFGYVHRDITGPLPRGPFDKIEPSPTATYPALWNHNARKETRIICETDSQLQARRGMGTKAATIWATASRAHLNLEFGFASQAITVAFTERNTIGGTAWLNVQFDVARFDYIFAVWGNSALGILTHWWHASLQNPGRGRMTIRSADFFPILDLRASADANPNRALLDLRVVCDMLGFDDAVYEGVRMLAAKWCAEPSVHGESGGGRWRG